MIYIYTLSHPLTNEVRYVGKTINIKRRYKQHLYDKRNSYKANWVKSLRNDGLKPILTILETCNEDNWQEREIHWIAQFDNLTNFLNGGGVNYKPSTSEETKEKIRQANLGKKHTKEHKDKLKDSSIKKRISIDGIIYESIIDASKILDIPIGTLHGRLNNPRKNNFFYF